jgi:hypothetical protein
VPPRRSNREYLRTKRTKFGHMLSLVAEKPGAGSRVEDPGKRRK